MIKAAILIDGGYLLKRLPVVRPDLDAHDAEDVSKAVSQLIRGHLNQLNEVHKAANPLQLLYRAFYYDAWPYERKAHTPIDKRPINFSRTPEALFRKKLFEILRGSPNLAVRLGDVRKDPSQSWILKVRPQKELLKGILAVEQLTDDDFAPSLRQKGVDMRIGLDIASITLKRQADVVVLVSGDADFVPAAKLARREGMQFVLDPLWHAISPDLFEHIDGLRSGFYKPRSRQHPNNEEAYSN